MSDPSDIAARQERLLMELAELGTGMARRLHEVAEATDDPERLAALGTAFHQVSRGVRQSLALRARFAAGTFAAGAFAAERPVRAAAPTIAPASPPRAETERTGWNEYERLDCDELLEELDRIADPPEGEPVDIGRAGRAIEAGIARLRSDLTAVSRTPALAALPGLGSRPPPPAARAALLGGAARLHFADSS